MGNTAFNMNQIILVVALFGSLVLSEEVVRKPKLFFVSTSATTTTLQTASICYVSTAAYATCSGRKRRAITALRFMETEVQPKQDEVELNSEKASEFKETRIVNLPPIMIMWIMMIPTMMQQTK